MNLADLFRSTAHKPEEIEQRSGGISIGDPALVEILAMGLARAAGEHVSPLTSMGLTAVYRSVAIIAGAIAGLPLHTYREQPADDGTTTRTRVPSWLDNPGGTDPAAPTPYEWKETLVVHMLLHGDAYGLGLLGDAGTIRGMQLLSPPAVNVEWGDEPGSKVYRVTMRSGEPKTYTSAELTQFMNISLDGLRGLTPIQLGRMAVGTGLAADKAAANMFANGLLMGGLVSGGPDLTDDQAKEIKRGIRSNMTGAEQAGDVHVVNADLKFHPWTMNAEDAQFIESRAFQVEEIARLYGVPKVLLAEDGASTWGSGIAELLRGMQRFTLAPWTSRIEGRLSRLLPRGQFCEFDYGGILAPTPSESIENLAREIEVGLSTINEGRRKLNREAINGGDVLPTPKVTPQTTTREQGQ